MIDASAMVEVLVGRDPEQALLDALAEPLCAPHLLDTEVLSVLRGLVLGGKLAASAAVDARVDYFDLGLARYEAAPLALRIWELRQRHTAYDASYLALAEVLGAPLVTCDRKLAASPAHVDVQVFAGTM